MSARPEHERLGRAFLVLGALGLLTGGLLALLLRWQLAVTSPPLSAAGHAKAFSAHGLVMIFWALAPAMLNGLGHGVLPSLVGSTRLALPGLGRAALLCHLASLPLLLAAVVADPAGVAGGWTFYPPLSTRVGSPGPGQSLALLALLLVALSLVLGATRQVVTILRLRRPGLSAWDMPLLAWGLLLAGILNVLFLPMLAAAALLVLCDRHMGTAFFLAGSASPGALGDPLAYQHLFWLFGHPEVYVLALPAWGILGDTFSRFLPRPEGARVQPLAMITVAMLSGLVYGHHLFVTGLSPLASTAFMTLTLLISLPATILVACWLLALHVHRPARDAAGLCALGALVTFGLGGLSGTLLGSITAGMALHDTLYVVGHFHLTLAGTSLLGLLAAVHAHAAILFGPCPGGAPAPADAPLARPPLRGLDGRLARGLDGRLARAHALLTSILVACVFSLLLVAGWSGQPRRLSEPYELDLVVPLLGINQVTSLLALVLVLVQGLFVAALVRACRTR